MVACGYFIPGRTGQGGGQAPIFLCCTLSDAVRGERLMDLVGSRWVPLGPIMARQGSLGTRMDAYLSRTSMWGSRVICQGSSGPVGPYRLK